MNRRSSARFKVAVGIATIIGSVAAVLALFQSPAVPPPVTTTTLPSSPPPTTEGPVRPSTTTTTTTPPTTQRPAEVFLSDLAPAHRSGDIRTGAVELGGELFAHSIRYKCSLFCNDPQGVVEYNLGRRYRSFKATLGVADDTQDTSQIAVFEVHADSQRIGRVQVRFGRPRAVSFYVIGALRLRLVAIEPDVENPLQAGANAAGGIPNHLPDVAWGDARVTR